MIKKNDTNPKINKSFILGRGFNLKTNSIVKLFIILLKRIKIKTKIYQLNIRCF
jgi:hypothetical protein